MIPTETRTARERGRALCIKQSPCQALGDRSAEPEADGEEHKGSDEAASPEPVIEVPAGLLGFPIGGEGLRSPFDDAVVDGDGAEQGKDIHQGLDGEANSG